MIGAETFRYAFFWDDAPSDLVERDLAGYPLRTGTDAPAWASPPPPCAIAMLSAGVVAAEAALVDVPVLVGAGERDTVPDPDAEAGAYPKADVTVFVAPQMAHMHNFARRASSCGRARTCGATTSRAGRDRMSAGPLDGLRVVDCSGGLAGAAGDRHARRLRRRRDLGRASGWRPVPRDTAACAVFNRGKRSVVLDLATLNGRAHLLDLVATADVAVQSWRPGVADRLGVGYDVVHARNPRTVYCSISGFGADGPYRDVPGHEAIVHALVGTMAEQPGFREGPIFEALPFASIGAAYLSLIGVLAALLRREDDGHGRHVETSLYDGALAYLSMMWGESAASAGLTMTAGRQRLVTRSFLCGDDEYLGVHTGAVGAFGRLMKVLGLDDRIPASESGLDMGIPLTDEQYEILESEIHTIFASEPRRVWVDRLRSADVCAIEHLPACAVFDTPQARHNGMVAIVDDAVLGRVEQVAPPAKFSKTPGSVTGPAPTPGLDTDAVLAELAGRTADRDCTVDRAGARLARANRCSRA